MHKLSEQHGQRHVLQRATRVEWSWGPIKQHQVPLMEIDPAGIMTDSNVSVMELLARHDASKATQQMLLDSFLNGFLFKLFRDKLGHPPLDLYDPFGFSSKKTAEQKNMKATEKKDP